MIAKDLINNTIMSMSKTASPMELLSWMEEYKVDHLPVVDGNQYVGLLAEADVFNIDDPEAPIGTNNPFLRNIYVKAEQHLYEVVKLMTEEKISVVPVLDSANKYLGVISRRTIIERFASYAAVNQPGGIIILSVNDRDYLASQIVQIVESNDAKLLSLFVSDQDDSLKMDITIKVNKQDISGILQTFDRYGYEVKATWLDSNNDYMQDRFDSLMNFLSI